MSCQPLLHSSLCYPFRLFSYRAIAFHACALLFTFTSSHIRPAITFHLPNLTAATAATPTNTQVVSLQRQLNASADETLRYTRAAEDRRNEVGGLSTSLEEEAARAEEAARRGEELRSNINAGWVGVVVVKI